jgi:hypothetical protein
VKIFLKRAVSKNLKRLLANHQLNMLLTPQNKIGVKEIQLCANILQIISQITNISLITHKGQATIIISKITINPTCIDTIKTDQITIVSTKTNLNPGQSMETKIHDTTNQQETVEALRVIKIGINLDTKDHLTKVVINTLKAV